MMMNKADRNLHELALEGLIARRQSLTNQIDSLRSVLDGDSMRGLKTALDDAPTVRRGRKPKRKLSAEARAKMAASQKKRWARAKRAARKPPVRETRSVQPTKPVTASKPVPTVKRVRPVKAKAAKRPRPVKAVKVETAQAA